MLPIRRTHIFAFCAAVALISSCIFSAAYAQVSYDLYFDRDANPNTGCNVSLTELGQTIQGVEVQLRAGINQETFTVDSVDLADCVGASFGGFGNVDGGYPVGLNNGVNGADVIELSLRRSQLNSPGGLARLYAVATNPNTATQDILSTIDGSDTAPGIFLGLPIQIPALSLLGLLFLGAILLLVGLFGLQRRKALAGISLLLVTSIALAMTFATDGQVDDWAGSAPLANDPVGDTTGTDSSADLSALFAALDDDQLFFRLDVLDVENGAPIAIAGTDTTLEDTAITLTLNGTDNEGDPLSFAIDSPPVNGMLGPITPVDDSSATVEYTPDADFNGVDSFTFTADDGALTSAPASFDVTVTAVNDAPSFTVGADQTVLEDAGAQTINAWVTGISAGPADEAGQALTFNITANDNTGLFSVPPAVAADGTLSFTPADDANGTANITLELMDDGGTADGGVDTSPTQTFSITVTAVNDAPEFTVGPGQTVLEDAGQQTVNAWATGISAGPADEAGQILTFNITNNTAPGLFAAGPAVAADGTLTYTPAANASGTATITLELMDDGGTADGGVDTSSGQTFAISITPVNDAPSFTAGADETVLEDAGPQTVNGWATGIAAGPADEAGQSLTFNITGNTAPGLFAAGPAVASDGTLTYTPADNANGSADITLVLMDNGGTANGGVDTSASQTFTINVTAVNDPPVLADDVFDTVANTLLQVGASQTVTPSVFVSGSLLDNDSDIDSGSLTASLNTATAGAIVNVAADGSFTYVPPVGLTGSDSFTYDVFDGAATVTATVTITLVGRIWYVDNTAAAGGMGRSSDPFDTLAEAEAADADNDTICIAFGTGTTVGYSTGYLIEDNGIRLLGEFAGCSINAGVNGNAGPTVVRTPTANRPFIDSPVGASAITLDGAAQAISNVLVRGLNISADVDGVAAATSGGGSIEAVIDDNVFDVAARGIDITQGLSLGSFEASTYTVSNNVITAGIDGISAVHAENSTPGTLNLAFNDNRVEVAATGAGIFLDGPTNDANAMIVSSFSGNIVVDAAARGIDVDRVTFDAGGGTDAPGGNTTIGLPGDRVAGDGIRLNQVLGGIAFGALSIFNDNGTGWYVRDAGSKTNGTFALSTTDGIVDTTNGTALDIDPVLVDLNFTSVSSTNANGQGSSNAFGGGIRMDVTDAQGGANANALTVGTFNVTSSNGFALSILNSVGVFTFGTTIIDNLTVPSSGGAVNMRSNAGDNATLNFTNGLDIDMFDGGDPAGATPGVRAIQVEAFSSGRATLSIADTANDESILITDSAGGFIEMTAEFTTGGGRVEVGPAGIHFDSLQATGTEADEELTDDGAIRMIEVGGAGNTFSVDMMDIVDGANVSVGITIEDSPPAFTFGSYNHQNAENSQTTPVRLTGDNGPVTFNNVTLGNTSTGVIGQPFQIVANNNPVRILGGEIVAGSTTTGVQLFNQNNTGSLTIENTNITNTLAVGGGDSLQVSGGGGTVTVTGGTFTNSTNSDGVDIQDTSATVDIGADILHTGTAGGGVIPSGIEIDNTSGDITFTGSISKANEGPLILIGRNGDPNGSANNGPTAGTIAFNGVVSSTAGTDGILINDLGVNAAIDFTAAVNITQPVASAITLTNSNGAVSLQNGGTITSPGADGVNCNASVFDMDNVTFTGTFGGVVMNTSACTLSGSGNSATPLTCTDGGGNTGTVLFNGGLDSCP